MPASARSQLCEQRHTYDHNTKNVNNHHIFNLYWLINTQIAVPANHSLQAKPTVLDPKSHHLVPL